MDFARSALDVLLGFVFGAVGGLFGIGGGLIAIPVLGVFYGFDQQHAQGTAMVMVAPNVFIGLYQYRKRSGLDMRLAAILALSGIAFMYIGARIATHVPSTPLRIGFATFQLALFASTLLPRREPRDEPRKARWPRSAAYPIGVLGGLISGIFGVGGAIFAVPLFTTFFGMTQAAAQGLGLAMVAPGTIVTIAEYALAHDVNWSVGIPLALGGVFSVPAGVALAHRLPDRVLRTLFGLVLLGSAVALYLRA
ncbi:MAG TPA: sulfite exporter TauE/SafE family protein [Candidatus Binatia bacterium]|nr:sulfite exporter TauE/SafE family protein [Candidatus Binatia bacterium]